MEYEYDEWKKINILLLKYFFLLKIEEEYYIQYYIHTLLHISFC